ncbi:MAG: type II secretion system protein [Planctomycetes bacterium]|nr:type II secretion system protein [Planctomycetota bacterium]
MPTSQRRSRPCPPRQPANGFTLVELLTVVAIIAILVAVLLPAIGLVREKSRVQAARQAVAEIGLALKTYALLDARHRYPLHNAGAASLYVPAATPTSGLTATPQPLAHDPYGDAPAIRAKDGSACGVLGALLDLGSTLPARTDAQGRLTDPWERPYLYQLTRPAPAMPANALQDWNWEATLGRPRAWNALASPPCAAPFPYVWSTGRSGSTTDATTWIYEP